MWFRPKELSRSELLARASHARGRGRRRDAMLAYLEILKNSPDDHEVHGKLAPLLAAAGRRNEAWLSYQAGAQGYLAQGFVDRALSLYQQAADHLADEHEVWSKLVALQLERGAKSEAVQALLDGHRHFTSRKERTYAVAMLQQAHELAPERFAVTFALARLLLKEKDARGEELLRHLAGGQHGAKRRMALARLFWLHPGPARLWQWLRA